MFVYLLVFLLWCFVLLLPDIVIDCIVSITFCAFLVLQDAYLTGFKSISLGESMSTFGESS